MVCPSVFCLVGYLMPVMPRNFYQRPTLTVAKDLLGKLLVHESSDGRTVGRIVETEAYIGEDDPACHAARGHTPRTATMYGPAGYAYVYFTYGMHFMFNVVTEAEGFPAAVLIRALEPLEGLELMRRRRGVDQFLNLCSGPAKLCLAMDIDMQLLGSHLRAGPLRVESERRRIRASKKTERPTGNLNEVISWSPRIGIRQGCDKVWRCYIAGNQHVSRGRPGPPAGRRRIRTAT